MTNHINAGADENHASGGHLVYKEIANCLSTSNQRIDYETETFVIQPQEAFVKVVRSGARDENGELPAEVWRAEQVGPTLNVFDNGSESRATVISVYEPASMLAENWVEKDIKANLRAEASRSSHAVVQETAQSFDEFNGTTDERLHHTLRAGTKQSTGVIETIADIGGEASQLSHAAAEEAVQASTVVRMRSGKPGGGKGALVKEEMSLTLATANDQALFDGTKFTYNVRRLTPRECERLQGWPDDHTRWADDGKEISDSARYKMCGNGISAPVAQWIGENIVQAFTND